MHTSKRHPLIALFTLAALVAPAAALEYTFEEKFFYLDAPIFGQGAPDALFSGVDTDQYQAQLRAGVGGSVGLVINDVDKDYGGVRLAPGDQALGGKFDAATSKVEFGFRYKQSEIGGKGICVRVMLGGDAVLVEIANSGALFILDGGKHPQKNYVGVKNFTPEPGRWIHVTGVLDYANRTFTAKVDNTPLNGGRPMDFRRESPEAGTVASLHILAMDQTNPDWAPIHFDDLKLKLMARE